MRAPLLRVGVAVALLAGCAASEREPPNVLVVVVDTFRADHIGGYGYFRDTTPHLDRLIAEGARFDAAIATGSWSPPSHVSILTGLLPNQHRVLTWGHEVPERVVSLAGRLGAHGYRTGLFSSHGGLRKGLRGFGRDFGHSFGTHRKHDERTLDRAFQWIRESERPWYAHAILMSTHGPYDRYPPEWDERYFTDVPPGGERTFPLAAPRQGRGIPEYLSVGDHRSAGYYANRYDRAVHYVDGLLGRFLARLEEEGWLDETLVVVTSDHGEGFGEHGHFGHGNDLYDVLLRVPLILRLPGRIPAGTVWSEPVSLVDLVPTALGFAGAPAPEGLPGIDLSGHLERGTRPAPRLLVSVDRSGESWVFAVRSASHKLIYDGSAGRAELYDLTRDPGERTNLLEGPPEEVPAAAYQELRTELGELAAAHGAAEVPEAPVLSAEGVEALRTLGYLEGPD